MVGNASLARLAEVDIMKQLYNLTNRIDIGHGRKEA